MKATSNLNARNAISTFATAALAGFIAVGILSAVAYLFQRDGKPFERLAAAERACAQHNYQSERQACMNEYLAAAKSGAVAHK